MHLLYPWRYPLYSSRERLPLSSIAIFATESVLFYHPNSYATSTDVPTAAVPLSILQLFSDVLDEHHPTAVNPSPQLILIIFFACNFVVYLLSYPRQAHRRISLLPLEKPDENKTLSSGFTAIFLVSLSSCF